MVCDSSSCTYNSRAGHTAAQHGAHICVNKHLHTAAKHSAILSSLWQLQRPAMQPERQPRLTEPVLSHPSGVKPNSASVWCLSHFVFLCCVLTCRPVWRSCSLRQQCRCCQSLCQSTGRTHTSTASSRACCSECKRGGWGILHVSGAVVGACCSECEHLIVPSSTDVCMAVFGIRGGCRRLVSLLHRCVSAVQPSHTCVTDCLWTQGMWWQSFKGRPCSSSAEVPPH